MILALFISAAIGAAFGFGITKVRNRRSSCPALGAKPSGSGWTLVRARSTEHFCRPPDTGHEPINGNRIDLATKALGSVLQ